MLNRRTFFSSLAAPFASEANILQTKPPFMVASIDDAYVGFARMDLRNSISPSEVRLYVDGESLAEAQSFDTRQRRIQFVVFDGVPRALRARLSCVTLLDRCHDDVVEEGVYVGPYTVTWTDAAGVTGSFEVK